MKPSPAVIKPKPAAEPATAEAIPLEALAALYDISAVETVHAVTESTSFYFAAEFQQRGPWNEITMPPGHYLIVKIVERPTRQAGLFAVRAPKE
jgi:hypothetical protein